MGLTIHVGWWAIPLAITIAAFGWANWSTKDDGSRGYALAGQAAVSLVYFSAATIISLVAWLIWALAA